LGAKLVRGVGRLVVVGARRCWRWRLHHTTRKYSEHGDRSGHEVPRPIAVYGSDKLPVAAFEPEDPTSKALLGDTRNPAELDGKVQADTVSLCLPRGFRSPILIAIHRAASKTLILERDTGLEPVTSSLGSLRSTN
jgi:hypothetical protein